MRKNYPSLAYIQLPMIDDTWYSGVNPLQYPLAHPKTKPTPDQYKTFIPAQEVSYSPTPDSRYTDYQSRIHAA